MMPQEFKYLKDISRVVREILSALTPKPPTTTPKSIWLRVIALVALVILVLSSPFIIARFTARNNQPWPPNGEATLGVEKLIRQIQIEIAKSEEARKAQGIAPMFELKSFELEISFVASKTSTQAGNAHFEIVTVDNQLQVGAEQAHRLKLIMDVVTPQGTVEQSTSQPPTDGQVIGSVPPMTQKRKGAKQ